MFDFRLKVFFTVAQRLSFTKAADELFISQPAVSKHIKEIEKQLGCRLFERSRNRLILTPNGEILKNYATEIFGLYQEMETEIKFLNAKHSGLLRIGASTTAAQYVLPGFLAGFKTDFPEIDLELKTGNTEEVERLITDLKIDIGIVEGKSKRGALDYIPFLKDEIVLCTQIDTIVDPIISIQDLLNLQFVIREKGSGTLEIIRSALIQKGLKLDTLRIEIVLENNESIKTYLQNSNAFAFISISAISDELKHKKLKIVDVEELMMDRYYYIVTKKGEMQTTEKLFFNQLLHNKKL